MTEPAAVFGGALVLAALGAFVIGALTIGDNSALERLERWAAARMTRRREARPGDDWTSHR